MVLRLASSFLEAQGPMNTTEASGCSFLIIRAVATMGVSSLLILSIVSGNRCFAITDQEGQQEVSAKSCLPVTTSFT